jgi:selenocysteine-specific elongation factor
MPREELKSRLKIGMRTFNAVLRKLAAESELEERGPLVLRPGHEIRFGSQQESAVQALLARFAASPYSPPSVKETQAEVGEEVYNALVDMRILVPVSAEVVFRQEDYESMVAEVVNMLERRGTLTAAQTRDHFKTSRRYALALLEYLDAIGVTVREGDARRLKQT